MADLNMQELQNLVREELMPGVRNMVEKISVEWQRLYKAKKSSNGVLRKVIDMRTQEPTLTNGRDTVVAPQDRWANGAGLKEMSQDYGHIVADVLIYEDDKIKNRGDKIVDLVKDRVAKASEGMVKKLGSLLFTGTGSNLQPAGLQAVVNDANTYANINRTVAGNEPFRSLVVPSVAARSITEKEIDETYVKLTTELAFQDPTILITTPTLWKRLRTKLIEVDKTFAAHLDTASYGLRNFIIGAPCIPDKYCPDGEFYFLSEGGEGGVYLYVQQGQDMINTPFLAIPDKPHAESCYIKFAWQIWCEQPKNLAKLTNLTE